MKGSPVFFNFFNREESLFVLFLFFFFFFKRGEDRYGIFESTFQGNVFLTRIHSA